MFDIFFNCIYYFIVYTLYIGNLYIINNKILNRDNFLKYSFCILTTIIITTKISQFLSLLIIITSLIFFRKDINKLISFIISYIIIMIVIISSDALVGSAIIVLFKIPYKNFLNSDILRIISNFSVLLISLFISFIVKKILKRIDFNIENIYINNSTKKLILSVVIIFTSIDTLIRTFTLSSIDTILDSSFRNYVVVLSILLFLLVTILYCLCKIINISFKNDFIDKENKQLKNYTDMLEKMSSDLRKFKHDYVNILYTLGDFINNGDIEGLRKYYNDDLLPASKMIVKSDKHITLLKNIKITPLKALVSYKLLAAQSQGIEINAEVLEEVDKLSIKTIDICRIIGIFLDNAIEAAMQCEKKFVHFAIIKTTDNIIIVILNSCPKNIPPIYQLYKKNFSTKGTNRGIGLTSVKELIDTSYKNILLNTSASNGVFKQELIIKEEITEETINNFV